MHGKLENSTGNKHIEVWNNMRVSKYWQNW